MPAAKKGILLVAFGTTIPEAQAALDVLDKKVRAAFPETEIFWAYSSKIVRTRLAKTGKLVDAPASALAAMMDAGITRVAVQSLHTIPGREFHGVCQTAHAFCGLPKGFQQVEVGAPLLSEHEDLLACAQAIMETLPEKRKPDEAVALMGHGTYHAANVYYPALQYYIHRLDKHIFIGTAEGAPSLDDIRTELQRTQIKTVYLCPFMAVAGDHAQNDLAGDDDDSWLSILTRDGFTCVPVLRGTAERNVFADIWLKHLQKIFAKLE